ncbi:BamA/TamA family outer membrane protein [Fulvivirga sp. M361]|uniref:BamA/TamA family outer membrane protein n=1 Tax=Fulvivirga sp. M361 TaxID=2594266 RepID=UPI00117B8FCA|nr:BamA/TamA family outer membrane protein [Fulvivirga sp. M361]TRX46450.1 BamA/TamA family outer membrane protein [Fulvivirga sp. M361]
MLKNIYPHILALVILLGSIHFGRAQSQNVEHRVYLLGNTADLSENSTFIEQFKELLPRKGPFTVVLSGDLINTDNLPSEQDITPVNKLLKALSGFEQGRTVIIPGDRDWANSGKNGLKSVKALEKAVAKMGIQNVVWAVSKGCPGPKSIELSNNLVLVTIDTQWWNHPFYKPQPADADCKIVTRTDFLNELREELEDANGKNLLVAGHHPLLSVGEYGGQLPARVHLSPPIYGSFRAAYHQNVGTKLDIVNKRFDPIRHKIETMVLDKSSTIYASGHDYDLQVLQGYSSFFINSGSVAEARFVGKDKTKVRFATASKGLIELVYYEDGKVDYVAHQSSENTVFSILKQETLLFSPCDQSSDNKLFNTSFIPCKTLEENQRTSNASSGIGEISGGNYPAKGMKKFLFGSRYRPSWNQPVRVPYLDLATEKQGLKVYEKGGGRQTTSLKMKGGDGREYAFRSVDKDPTSVLGRKFRGTIVSETFKDVTSMQHPYGAMVISTMLDKTDILHASPELFILPDDPKLGPFRKKYANLLGMLEEKPINIKKTKVPFAEAEEVLQTYKMFRKLYKDNDNIIDKREYSQARMFDILVGDWGRHEDNWKWAGYSNDEGGMTYRPIPRDRDHVFSRWDGFLTWLADRKWAKASGENFDYTIKDIRSLTWQSRHFDRFLLSELSKQDWEAAAAYIQSKITDDVIEEAIKKMPEEIYPLSGQEIEGKLKQRLKDLKKYATEYYRMLSKEVDVVGSNKKEHFEVIREPNGSVKVTVQNIKKDGSTGRKLYTRVFDPKETKEIRLFGLDGSDQFTISGEVQKSIKIRVIGGPGPDKITDESIVRSGGKKTLIYEKDADATLNLGSESKQISHWDNKLYNYNRTRFAYNRYRPIFSIGSNSTAGFGGTIGIQFKRQKFGKPDFSAIHKIKGRFTTQDIMVISYDGRYRHALGKWDVELNGLFADNNDFNKFFGPGNGSINDDQLDDNDFYNTRYETVSGGLGVVRDFWKKSTFRLGVHLEESEPVIEPGTILALIDTLGPDLFGVESLSILEAVAELNLDFRDRADLPEQGMRLYLKYQSGFLTNKDNDSYGVVQGFVEKYATWQKKNPWTLSARLGGSTSYGEDVIPFYKQAYLGQQSNLRGYEQNRFTGRSLVFINSELRIQLTEFQTSIIPIKFGIKGFYDTGRVYSDFDTTDQFHAGYGFGVYFVPIKESFSLNISAGFSEEESGLLLISIGGAIN